MIIKIFRSQKTSDLKKSIFLYVFDSFPPFLFQKSELLPSIITIQSFLKIDGIDSFLSIFEKDRP